MPPESPGEQRLLARLLHAWERAEVGGIVSLLSEDGWQRMPPVPLEYQGPGPVGRFLAAVVFREDRRYPLVPARANGQPAFGVCVIDRASGIARANAFLIINLSGSKVSAITRFDCAVIARFGLPRTLPGDRLRGEGDRSAGITPE